jgi:hypothetical protein
MTGNESNAKSVCELSAEELDAAAGGEVFEVLASMYRAFAGANGWW